MGTSPAAPFSSPSETMRALGPLPILGSAPSRGPTGLGAIGAQSTVTVDGKMLPIRMGSQFGQPHPHAAPISFIHVSGTSNGSARFASTPVAPNKATLAAPSTSSTTLPSCPANAP